VDVGPRWTGRSLPLDDLEHVFQSTRGLWSELDGARILITGGTGFFGQWLLGSLLFAARTLRLDLQVVVLTRDAERFRRAALHIANDPRLRVLVGDVRTFDLPDERFSHVIHAATDAGTRLNEDDPLLMVSTIVDGTRRVLDLARRHEVRALLLTSSGAVYGRQPPDLSCIDETFAGAPDPVRAQSAYGEGKRVAEHLCALYHTKFGVPAKIARCFAFIGPGIQLDAQYAIGNFIRDALRGGPIMIKGDGTPYRSYLHTADLAVWLWVILLRATPARPYNVGSETAVTIADLAQRIAARVGTIVHFADSPASGVLAERYVPCTARARDELGLKLRIDLDDALDRTLRWYRGQGTTSTAVLA